jgi:hypothetical protein
MSLLEHPDAQALLDDATVSADSVRDCTDRLTGFLRRYLPRFYRIEQRANATTVIHGLLSGLERKTCEPIAIDAVTCSPWTGPADMRVILAHEGRRTPDEAHPPLARADHPQAP